MSFGASPFASYTFGDDGTIKYDISADDITGGTPTVGTSDFVETNVSHNRYNGDWIAHPWHHRD